MPSTTPHMPARPSTHIPGGTEPGTLPVEPDQGPIPPFVPQDPQPDRIGDPPVSPVSQVWRARGPVGRGR